VGAEGDSGVIILTVVIAFGLLCIISVLSDIKEILNELLNAVRRLK